MTELLDRAAAVIREAEALLIAAGAGMGVDSGLPDFRGPEGFWKAYPSYAKLGLRFTDLADPRWFRADPTLAWGFYGHRLNLYRAASPHEGFDVLLSWSRSAAKGAFVFTSNVDGHFQRAGFPSDKVLECHGSVHFMQCTRACSADIFSSDALRVEVDETTMRANEPLPSCPDCGALARPNILMFDDWGWNSQRAAGQEESLLKWLGGMENARMAVIECGAGTAVPTVRLFCEQMVQRHNARLIRINLREPEVPAGHIGIAMGSRDALATIAVRLGSPSVKSRLSG